MNITEKEEMIMETIAFPVIYDNKQQTIWDAKGMMVCDIRGWGKIQFMGNAERRQDAIGEKIAKLLNEDCIIQKEIEEPKEKSKP